MYKDKFPKEVKFGVTRADSFSYLLTAVEMQHLKPSQVADWIEDGDLLATYQLVRVEKAQLGVTLEEVE